MILPPAMSWPVGSDRPLAALRRHNGAFVLDSLARHALRVPQIGWMSRITCLSVGLVLAGPVVGVRVQVVDLLMATMVMWLCWRYIVDPRGDG